MWEGKEAEKCEVRRAKDGSVIPPPFVMLRGRLGVTCVHPPRACCSVDGSWKGVNNN